MKKLFLSAIFVTILTNFALAEDVTRPEILKVSGSIWVENGQSILFMRILVDEQATVQLRGLRLPETPCKVNEPSTRPFFDITPKPFYGCDVRVNLSQLGFGVDDLMGLQLWVLDGSGNASVVSAIQNLELEFEPVDN